MASDTVERLLIRIDATTEVLRRELKKADASIGGFDKNVGRQLAKIDQRFQSFQRNINGLLAGAFSIYSAKRFFDYIAESSNIMINMRAQLKLVTNSQAEMSSAFENLLKISNLTGQSLDSTVTLFARLARNTEDLAISQTDLLRMTETLNKAFVVSGATGREASNAMIQLSQAFGKGRLDGEELNAVMEQAPILAREIAKSAGIGYGGLKQAAEEGKLTTDILIDAIDKLRVKVDNDFNQIPVTIERAMNELRNNLLRTFGDVDTGPLVESIQELSATVGDPKVQENLRAIAAGIVSVANAMAQVAAWSAGATTGLSEFLAQTIGGADSSGGDIQQMIDSYGKLNQKIMEYEATGRRITPVIAKQINERNKLKAILEIEGEQLLFVNGKWQLLDGTLQEVTVSAKRWETAAKSSANVTIANAMSSKEHAKALREATKQLKPYEKLLKSVSKTISDGLDEYDDQIEATKEYIKELEIEVSLLGKTEDAQALLRIEHEASARAGGELRDRIVELNTELYNSDKAAKASEEAARQMEQVWSGARDTLSDFFFEFARDGKNAFDTLVDGFKAMIAKMIAEAAANRIILGIGTVASGMGFSSVASAATAAGGGGGVGGILSSIGGMGAGMYGNIGDALSYIGADRLAQQSYLTGMTATPGSLAMSAGAGLLGGFAGNAVFGGGGYSNIGATIGGLGGSIFGPIGAGVGSFLGSGIGSLFGGDNNGDNKGRASINLATGESNVFGVGKSFNQANVDALNSLVPFLQNLADALGGSSANLDVSMGNNSGLSLNGQRFGKDEAGFIAAAIEAMVDGAKTLSPLLKTLIKGFDGTSEELANFAVSMVGITELIAENPVDKAFKDFSDAQQAAGMRLTQVYDKQIRELDKLIYGFDGSAQAAVDLNQALAQNKQLAYDMALAIKAIGESTGTAVNDQIRYFREQTRTPDEQLVAMEREFARLLERLPDIKNPENIDRVTQRLLALNQAIFDAGPDDLQRSNRQTYIDAARFIEEQQAIALENAGQTLQASQQDLNTQVGAMLEVAASGFQTSADTMMSASQLMFNAVQQFIQQGGYNEVAA